MTSTDQDLTVQAIAYAQSECLEEARRQVAYAVQLAGQLQFQFANYRGGPAGVISSDTRRLAQVVTQLTTAVGALAALAQVAPRD